MIRNALFQLHWLAGITAGVVLAVVGATGALLSFEGPIIEWLSSDVRQVRPQAQGRLQPTELLERIAQQHPDKPIEALWISSDPLAASRVTFGPGGGASNAASPPGRPRRETRFVDPYTGTLIEGEGFRGQAFFRNVRQLHRWLMLGELGSRDVGRQIVGASTLLLLFFAISGLYLRWPRGRHTLCSWLGLDFSLKGRPFLWALHSVAGTWVLVFYVVMGLTGLYWSYEWYRDGLYALTDAPRPERPGGARPDMRAAVEAHGTRADVSAAWLTFARATASDGFTSVAITLPREADGPVELRYLDADPAHERAFNTLVVDAASGEIRRHERYADKPAGAKLMSSIFPLHSGSFFGLAGIIVFMLASLAMPLFTVTGWMMYLERRRRRARARARMSPGVPEASGSA